MPRFFTTDIDGNTARISGEDARHIAKSLRMRPGEEITLSDGAGFDYRCRLSAVSPDYTEAEILEKSPNKSEPRVKIRLYQALPKSGKLEFIVQKAVELGVSEIVPVLTRFCVSRPDHSAAAGKAARLQKIAEEAAKQSGRGIIPQVLPLCPFAEAIAGMKTFGRAILFYENAGLPLRGALVESPGSLAVMIGGEGGFSPEEAGLAGQNGIALASLGPRILRCETAGIAAISAILFALGEF